MADLAEKPANGCTVQMLDVHGQPYCEEPVTVSIVTGCAHEHLDEDRYCSRHLGLLRDGWLVCVPCGRAGVQEQVAAVAEVLPSGERVRVLAGASLEVSRG